MTGDCRHLSPTVRTVGATLPKPPNKFTVHPLLVLHTSRRFVLSTPPQLLEISQDFPQYHPQSTRLPSVPPSFNKTLPNPSRQEHCRLNSTPEPIPLNEEHRVQPVIRHLACPPLSTDFFFCSSRKLLDADELRISLPAAHHPPSIPVIPLALPPFPTTTTTRTQQHPSLNFLRAPTTHQQPHSIPLHRYRNYHNHRKPLDTSPTTATITPPS